MLDPSLYACAPHVSPATLSEIVRVESSGNPIAINVNVIRGRPRFPVPRIRSAEHAAQVANAAIAQGYNVDLGLMQVNSRNLRVLGYTVEQMLFDRCLNVKAGAEILTDNYRRASRIHGPGQRALLAALSAYNTGNFERGFSNGYVSRYFNVRSATISIAPVAQAAVAEDAPPPPPNPYTADLSVYSRELIQNDTTSSDSAAPVAVAATVDP
jgi:type IV secretion system protein VirB1